VVEFTLGRAGELLAVSVARSSGVRGMDRAAVEAVKMAAPFEEIPSAIESGELRIRALFVYD
jgi:TonB family protein